MPFQKTASQQEEKEFEELLKDPELNQLYKTFHEEYEFKKALALARKEQCITQQELSTFTGLSQQAISRIENVNQTISFTFKTLFRYLDGIGYELVLKKKD